MISGSVLAGVDIGAGSGAKVGIFDLNLNILADTVLDVEDYGKDAATLVAQTARSLQKLTGCIGPTGLEISAVGVVGPGVFMEHGTIAKAVNLSFLNGINLGRLFGDYLGVPTASMNDADAGALAEWRHHRSQIIFWVLGGGWGGAWVSGDGEIRFRQYSKNAKAERFHPSCEPGHTIFLERRMLQERFADAGLSFDDYEKLYVNERGQMLSGLAEHGDDSGAVRSEVVVSGTGRWLIMRLFAEGAEGCLEGLTSRDVELLADSTGSGEVIRKVEQGRLPLLDRTDALFGALFAEAGALLLARIDRDGGKDIPVYIAGRPSKAFFSFGPYLRKALKQKGINNPVRLSELERRNTNPNLAGAAYLALSALKI